MMFILYDEQGFFNTSYLHLQFFPSLLCYCIFVLCDKMDVEAWSD